MTAASFFYAAGAVLAFGFVWAVLLGLA